MTVRSVSTGLPRLCEGIRFFLEIHRGFFRFLRHFKLFMRCISLLLGPVFLLARFEEEAGLSHCFQTQNVSNMYIVYDFVVKSLAAAILLFCQHWIYFMSVCCIGLYCTCFIHLRHEKLFVDIIIKCWDQCSFHQVIISEIKCLKVVWPLCTYVRTYVPVSPVCEHMT